MLRRDHLGIAGLEEYLSELGAEVRSPAPAAFTTADTSRVRRDAFTAGAGAGAGTKGATGTKGAARDSSPEAALRRASREAAMAAREAAARADAARRAQEERERSAPEASYSVQNEVYAARRLPIWTARLDSVEAETRRIEAALAQRTAGARIAGSGENAVLVMPERQCPPGGPLAYAYADLFQAAQANLQALGQEKPPRFTDWARIERWYSLIADNIDLLLTASNIYPLFRFPESVRRRGQADRFEYGSRETLRTQQGGFGPGETPVYREGLPYPKGASWDLRAPQSVLDLEESLYRNERDLNRISGDFRSVGTPSEECFYGGACLRPIGTYNQRMENPLRSLFRRFESSDHIGSKRGSLSAFARAAFSRLFNPSEEQLRAGGVLYFPGGFTGFWQSLGSVFVPDPAARDPRAADYQRTRRFFSFPANDLAIAQFAAQEFSRLSLPTMLKEAIGFYVFNHNVWYAEKLGLTPEQLRAQQRAVSEAGLDAAMAPVLGTTAAVGSLINPLIAVIIPILNAVGKELLNAFIRFPVDTPKPLFLRVPDPAVCTGRPEDLVGSGLCPTGTTGTYPNCTAVEDTSTGTGTGTGTGTCPPGTTGTPPNCTPSKKGGGGGLVFGAAALLLLSRLVRKS